MKRQTRDMNDYNIRSVERALRALQCFSGSMREISLMEFSRRLELNKSTAFRILATLRNAGFLEMTDDGRYRLGAEIARLGRLTDCDGFLKRESQPTLKKLAKLSGETLSICKYDNGRMACISKIESQHVLKCICVLDSDIPMLKGATGKVVAAHLPQEELRRCIQIQKMAGNPVSDPIQLEADFKKIRKNGYYISHSEYDERINALGVPIFGKYGEVVGSLSIVGPDSRFVDDAIIKILPDVLQEVKDLSKRMGYEEPAPEKDIAVNA